MRTVGGSCSHGPKYSTHWTERQGDISAQPGCRHGRRPHTAGFFGLFVPTGICNAFVKREPAYLSLSLWDKGRPVTITSRELENHTEGQLKVLLIRVIYHNY